MPLELLVPDNPLLDDVEPDEPVLLLVEPEVPVLAPLVLPPVLVEAGLLVLVAVPPVSSSVAFFFAKTTD